MQSQTSRTKKVLSFVTGLALALSGSIGFADASQAADAGKVFFSFETTDALGPAAAGRAFEGASAQIIDSSNLTGKSLEFTKSGQAWSGLNLLLSDTTSYIYAPTGNSTISFDYWSNDSAASPVMIKLETATPSWQGGPWVAKTLEAQPGKNTLNFDVSTGTYGNGGSASTEWKVVAVFPNFKADDTGYTGADVIANSDQKYEIDNFSVNGGTLADVVAPSGGPAATSTLLTFETDDAVGALIAGASSGDKPQGGFEGADTSIADAPAGGNGGKALKIQKKTGGAVYAGVNMIKLGSDARITDSTHKLVTFNFYSPKANVPVRLELTPWPVALGLNVTAAQGWQTLSFDLSTATGNDGAVWSADTVYTQMALFPDFNNAADDSVYYVDNFAFNGATTPAIVVPKAATSTLLTFEAADALGAKISGAASGEKPQGGFEGAATSIAAAPAGGNGGNALKIVKATGGQVYAGVNMLIGTDFRITDATHKIITFNYYSPKANSPVRLELTPWPVALGMNVTAAQGWQTLTFDLSQATGNNGVVWSADTEYTSLALFPDFNAVADNAVYYVDNFAINGATTPAIPVVPTAVAPVLKTAASIAGTAKVARTLVANKGSWTGTPTPTYTYKWYRCTVSSTKTAITAPTSAMKCSTIVGKTTSSYKLTSTDVGKYIRVLVTAKNSKGTKYSLSKTTAKVVK